MKWLEPPLLAVVVVDYPTGGDFLILINPSL